MPEHFDGERTASRTEAAALLRAVADGVERGTVELADADGRIAVDVPDDLTYGLELETVDAGGGRGVDVELEVELEWPAGPDSAVAVPAADRGPGSADDAASDEAPIEGEGEPAESATESPSTEADIPVVSGGGPGSAARFELFTDRADEWRWRLVHDNGNVIADGGEGYTRKANARKGLESVRANAPGAEIVEVADEQ